MSGSASGTLTASVAHAANRGCDTTDFNGNQFSGRIAIVRRGRCHLRCPRCLKDAAGSCYFSDKVANAVANGAIAVVIYNSGDDANHMGMVHGTVGSGVTVPVFAVSYITGLLIG